MDKTHNKKKLEFSKFAAAAIMLVLLVYAIWAGVEYYHLSYLAIQSTSEGVSPIIPNDTLAVTCVTAILGVFASYCLYQFGLKNSLNKNNLTVDRKTGITQHVIDGNAVEVLKDIIDVDNNEKEEETAG